MESGRETRQDGSARPPERDRPAGRAWRPASIAVAVAVATASAVLVAPAASASHFDASFDPVPGNEWWVEVRVDATGDGLVGVDARANNGEWHELERTDWGSWAKSFHVPEGSVMEFRAHGDDGETVRSGHYLWPDAEFLPCPPAFEASFDPKPGNEWWVEVEVGEFGGQVEAVHARVDGGEWHSLDFRTWGAWAKSFHVEEGSEVEFRATSQGQASFSDVYRWPDAERVADGATLDVAFGPKASSEWWVETYAIAEQPVEKVEACIGDGVWHDLPFRDWHAWAESFHVPDDSEVQFRATDDRGLTDRSEGFVWPSADPVGGAEGWPHEGSYAHYEAVWGSGSRLSGDVDAIFVHHDGTWRLMCEGEGIGDEPFFEHHEFAPPDGPTDAGVGQREDVQVLWGCDVATFEVTVEERRQRDGVTRQEGDVVDVTTWYGEGERASDFHSIDWEVQTGLLVRHDDGGVGWSRSTLEDTDADIAR